jgi:hypothetical protein
VRALAGGRHLMLALGLDFELGFAVPGAFVWSVHLLPLGGALVFASRGHLSVVGGLGASGVTDGQLPAAFELPVDAELAVDLGRYLRVTLGARATWVPGARREVPVDELLPLGLDQVDLRAGLSLGTRADEHRVTWGDGVFLGAILSQRDDSRWLGLVLAIDIAAGARPRGEAPLERMPSPRED